MRLAEIVINNFCSCQAVTIPLNQFNPIVGYNNSGKSNILRAINWLLKKSVLSQHMYHDPAQPITVEGEIEGVNVGLLPQNQQIQVAPFITNGRMRIRRRQDIPGTSAAQIKIDVFDHQTGTWKQNPTGLDNAIAVMFPEPLYIGAMEDAGEDVGKFGAKNTIGLLLKYVLEAVRNNNAAALAAIQQALQALGVHFNGPQRIQELGQFEASATQAIASFFPGLSFHIDISTPQLDDLFKGASVSLCDVPGFPRPFTSFGHGAQRSAHMALIKLLADQANGANAAGGTVVLLVDEPELYLHPQAVEMLRESFKALAHQGFQVVFSTHSPLLIDRGDVLDTSVVYKNAVSATVVRQKLSTATHTISAHPHHTAALFSLQNASYLLFSEKVVLVEGKTEQMILPALYQLLKGHSLAHDRYCMIEASGSSSIPPMLQVLAAVGYTAKVIADLDYVFKVAPAAGQVNSGSQPFLDCVAWFGANAPALGIALDHSGLPVRKKPNGTQAGVAPAEAYELMAASMQPQIQQLTQPLLAAGIWIWTRGAIEAHLGTEKNDTSRIQFVATAKASGNIAHAAHGADVNNLVGWL